MRPCLQNNLGLRKEVKWVWELIEPLIPACFCEKWCYMRVRVSLDIFLGSDQQWRNEVLMDKVGKYGSVLEEQKCFHCR